MTSTTMQRHLRYVVSKYVRILLSIEVVTVSFVETIQKLIEPLTNTATPHKLASQIKFDWFFSGKSKLSLYQAR